MIGWLKFAGILAASQAIVLASAAQERHSKYALAREYADLVQKPMLVAGGPSGIVAPSLLRHGCGDVCLDISADACSRCDNGVDYIAADIRDIPYTDGHFGSAFASHIIEHMPTISDAEQALDELYRVADEVFVCCPSKFDLIAQIHPSHHLWVSQRGDSFHIEQR